MAKLFLNFNQEKQPNSLFKNDWQEKLLYTKNGIAVVEPIGKMIDRLLGQNTDNITHIEENRTEYLELDDDINIKVPSIDCGDKKSGGHMNWCKVSAITRHLPVGDLVKIKTESGREVIATQQKSFLIWNKDLRDLRSKVKYEYIL